MEIKGLSKIAMGRYGEDLAFFHVQKAGLKAIQRNYRCPKGEIDLIVRDGETIVFIEVRSRTSGSRGFAEESISKGKAQKLRNTATYYFVEKGYQDWPLMRFDVIAILFQENTEVKWLKNVL